jgi:hypothetical protein
MDARSPVGFVRYSLIVALADAGASGKVWSQESIVKLLHRKPQPLEKKISNVKQRSYI